MLKPGAALARRASREFCQPLRGRIVMPWTAEAPIDCCWLPLMAACSDTGSMRADVKYRSSREQEIPGGSSLPNSAGQLSMAAAVSVKR